MKVLNYLFICFLYFSEKSKLGSSVQAEVAAGSHLIDYGNLTPGHCALLSNIIW